jgi:hypothetical protein
MPKEPSKARQSGCIVDSHHLNPSHDGLRTRSLDGERAETIGGFGGRLGHAHTVDQTRPRSESVRRSAVPPDATEPEPLAIALPG